MPIVRNINDINLKFEKENIVKNIISIGNPIYKSVISIYLPRVFLILFIVIYKLSHPCPIPVTIHISLWHYCSNCFTHIFFTISSH